jgi:hypothetical protein
LIYTSWENIILWEIIKYGTIDAMDICKIRRQLNEMWSMGGKGSAVLSKIQND